MSTFAKIDENNKVIEVIAADRNFINSGAVGDPSKWIECAIDHSIRGKYPGLGDFYDAEFDEFRSPKPPGHPSWIWNGLKGNEGSWVPPLPFPGTKANGEEYEWNEHTVTWDRVYVQTNEP